MDAKQELDKVREEFACRCEPERSDEIKQILLAESATTDLQFTKIWKAALATRSRESKRPASVMRSKSL